MYETKAIYKMHSKVGFCFLPMTPDYSHAHCYVGEKPYKITRLGKSLTNYCQNWRTIGSTESHHDMNCFYKPAWVANKNWMQWFAYFINIIFIQHSMYKNMYKIFKVRNGAILE